MGLLHRHRSAQSNSLSPSIQEKDAAKSNLTSRPPTPPTDNSPNQPLLPTSDDEKKQEPRARCSTPLPNSGSVLTPPLTPFTEHETDAMSAPDSAFADLLQKAKRKAEQESLIEKQKALEAYIAGTGPKPAFLDAELQRQESQPSCQTDTTTTRQPVDCLADAQGVPDSNAFAPSISKDDPASNTISDQPHRSRFCQSVRDNFSGVYQQMESQFVNKVSSQFYSMTGAQLSELFGGDGQAQDGGAGGDATTDGQGEDEQVDDEQGAEEEEEIDAE